MTPVQCGYWPVLNNIVRKENMYIYETESNANTL